MPRNTNKPAVQGAKSFLNNLKYEMAGELGLGNYETVGGYMTRKMVQFAEEHLKNGGQF